MRRRQERPTNEWPPPSCQRTPDETVLLIHGCTAREDNIIGRDGIEIAESLTTDVRCAEHEIASAVSGRAAVVDLNVSYSIEMTDLLLTLAPHQLVRL